MYRNYVTTKMRAPLLAVGLLGLVGLGWVGLDLSVDGFGSIGSHKN